MNSNAADKSNDHIPRDEMRLAIRLQEAAESWRKPARRQRRRLLRDKWWQWRAADIYDRRAQKGEPNADANADA